MVLFVPVLRFCCVFLLFLRSSCNQFFYISLTLVALLSYHVVGPISDGLVAQGRDTLLGVAVTGAAALHYQVVNGKMLGGEMLACSFEVFGLARTRLVLQQANSDVGDFELLLALVSERIQGFPLWKATVDHLSQRERDQMGKPSIPCCSNGY